MSPALLNSPTEEIASMELQDSRENSAGRSNLTPTGSTSRNSQVTNIQVFTRTLSRLTYWDPNSAPISIVDTVLSEVSLRDSDTKVVIESNDATSSVKITIDHLGSQKIIVVDGTDHSRQP
jgi:hypothetical protein